MSKWFLSSSLLIASIIRIYMCESDSVKQFTLLKGRYIWSFFSKEDFRSTEFIIGRCLLHYSPLTTPCMIFPSAPYLLSHRMQWEVGRKPNTSEGIWSKFCTGNIMLNWGQITLTKDTRWQEKHNYPFYIPSLLTLYWWWPQREMKYCQVCLKYCLSASPWFSLLHIHLFIQKKTRAEENCSDVSALGSCVLLLLRTK